MARSGQVVIDFSEAKYTIARLQAMRSSDAADLITGALNAAGEAALSLLVDMYPTDLAPSWAEVGWPVSEKQRRWFFWALRTGAIKIPYVRTGRLGASMTYEVLDADNADQYTLRVGTNWPEAEYVIGTEEQQSPMHRGRWEPLVDTMDNGKQLILDTFEQRLIDLLLDFLT